MRFLHPLATHRKPNAILSLCRLLSLGGFLMSLSSIAQTVAQAPESPTLSWQEAIKNTLEKNPSLIAFGYQFTAQEARILQAGLKPNPELNLSVEDAFGTGEHKSLTMAETTLSISWVIETEQRQARVVNAQKRASLLETERDIQRLDTAAETAHLYIQSLALQTRQQQTEQALQFAKDALVAIRQRVDAGRAPAAELARGQAEVALRELDDEDIEHELKVTLQRLAAQWGDTSPAFSRVAGNLFQLPNTADLTNLKARLQNNPRLAIFATKARWEESQLALIKAQSKAQWRLTAGVKQLAATDEQALVAGISLPLNVFDRQQGRTAEAIAQIDATHAEEKAEQLKLISAVFGLEQELLHNLHVINRYQKAILPSLEKALLETRRAYDAGRYSYLEWQAAQRELFEANKLLVDASVTAHLKAIEIERLTGTSITPHAQ